MIPAELQHSGTHLVADLHGIARALLCDSDAIEALLRQAALAAGATIVYSHFHAFGPGQGVTGVVLLAESHISIHTWPETGFAALDIFMCGGAEPRRALGLIEAGLTPAASTVQELPRGYSVVGP
ncbi:adenosylmethionine decarboxylase [Janthinobacterium sp. 17J80-10]|uniref:adenosylmethionine decarboxylase n=1 Tax=Janthinobacterium sp. 17J80-10 TaxID=2497863 RepID=UPI0010059471|nr:adenosylmethionine decarboxylase [Janthinobacterium sp. 17J80-10]QAU32945.1 adenosylmethionine decarboxylase [Janthinobacterium sp. 17J80-10]